MKPPQDSPWRTPLTRLYDSYYASQDYARRYPVANAATLAWLRRHGVDRAGQVLDIGCGDGRYLLPLLAQGEAAMTGCDIAPQALAALATRLAADPARQRVTLIAGGIEAVPPDRRYDALLLLFGVLAHAGLRADRVALLAALARHAAPGAHLYLSVPSLWRRRPLELLRARLWPQGGHQGWQESWRDITFTRCIAGRPQTFFYHLYTPASLRAELAAAGWQMLACAPESALPEWLVTRSRLAALLDAPLRALLPAALGYGIRAVARPVPQRTGR